MSSKAHFCVLTLPMLYAVVHWACVRRDRVQLALLLLVFATGTLTVKGLVGTSVGNELLARGSVCWHTVLTLWACGRALRSGFGPSVNAATAAS